MARRTESHDKGCPAVVDCLIDTDIYTQVEKSLDVTDHESAPAAEAVATNEQLQRKGDRDNLVIMIKELLSRDVGFPFPVRCLDRANFSQPESLPKLKKNRLRELMNRAVSLRS